MGSRLAVLIVVVVVAALPRVAAASLIWDGDASRGTGVFKIISSDGNCGEGSITAVDDAARGKVWRYNKPSASNRCENHGIKVNGSPYVFQNGSTYYLGWWSKLSSTANNNANFQWKSYGSHQQNFPIVMKVINGKMTLMQRQPGGVETFLWSRAISANTWNHYVLGLKLSNQTRGGHIEFWFNGVKQSFTTGGDRFECRTYDSGNHNCPKWGVYGGRGKAMVNFVDGLKIGTRFEDVAPASLAAASVFSETDGEDVSADDYVAPEDDHEIAAPEAQGCSLAAPGSRPAGGALVWLVVAAALGACRARWRRRSPA